ncbi:Lrp/AsnC family transcriptional regulator [Halorubellus litoreus]|uniref:Lrp/AsnC family transcriptional regulator n=1 Tax=Halorubellus litoreus TaxID=755308 RepID=A0ABD5VLN7_9EURY
MTLNGLDDLDRHILFVLQQDARESSSNQIAERMGVSPSTVRKRIDRLEREGVINSYRADVDYANAGFDLQLQIICTAPIPERDELTDGALEVSGVVGVREIATGEGNVVVRVVAEDNDDLNRIARELSDLGLAVSDEQLIRREEGTPYDGFEQDGGV